MKCFKCENCGNAHRLVSFYPRADVDLCVKCARSLKYRQAAVRVTKRKVAK